MIMSSWQRPPFLIDPCSEGMDWLRWLNKMMNDAGIITLDMETSMIPCKIADKETVWRSDPQLLVTIEKCIIKGRHVLLKNCAEEIDSDIMPLIYHRNFCSEDEESEEPRMIRFCGRRILCHPKLRLFLATNLPKPKMSPDVASTTEVINYGTSAETLMDDLLTRSFARIRRELYLERRLALQTTQEVKAMLVQIVAYIKLQIYKNVDSKVLWNESDVETIATTIEKKDECYGTWKNAQSVLHDIDQLRDELFPIARRGATLYTVIRSLPSIRQEYQFTLDYFLKLFDEAVGAEPPPEFYHKVAEVGEDVSLLDTPAVAKQRTTLEDGDRERTGSLAKQREDTEVADDVVEDDGAPEGDGDATSRRSTSPESNQLSDLHQLIIIRMLRPDRLPFAMSKYVTRYLGLAPQPAPTLHDIMESMGNHHYGILVLLPPGAASSSQQTLSSIKMTKDPVQTINELAENLGITVENIKMSEGCELQADIAIDQAEKNDGWVLIEDLHLAPEKFFPILNYNLIRVMKGRARLDEEKRNQSKFCIWVTSEPSERVPEFMLKRLHKLSWDNVTLDLIKEDAANGGAQQAEGEGDAGSQGQQSYGGGGGTAGDEGPSDPEILEYAPAKTVLTTAISAALRSISPKLVEKLQEMANAQKIAPYIYGLSVCQGVLQARQVFGCRGMSQWSPFNTVHLQQSIEILLKSLVGEEEELNSEKVCANVSKIVSYVYGNVVSYDWDRDYVTAILNYIMSHVENPSITLGSMEIPIPPANTEVTEFGSWFDEQMKNKDMDSAGALDLPMDVERIYNEASSHAFIEHLDRLYETSHMDTGDVAPVPFTDLSMFRLRSALELCTENLPPLLELGDESKLSVEENYNFPYHCPSVLSFSTATSVMMPESIGYILLQECLWLNSLLCHVRQNIFELQQCLLTGPDSIPPKLQQTAKSIQQENVPTTWVHPNCQPCTHTLLTWLTDLKKRYDQMYKWVKNGMVPMLNNGPTPAPRGQVRSIWLGGLVNPPALFMALRHEKAVLSDCLIDEVVLVCDVSSSAKSPELEEDEAGVVIKELNLQASWDSGANCLAKAENDMNPMPPVHVQAITRSQDQTNQDETQKYDCPVFMNKARQVCSLVLPLPSDQPVSSWTRCGTALIIDAGIPEGSTRRTKAHRTMKQAQLAISPRIVDFESERGSTVSPLVVEKEVDKSSPSNLTASQQYSSQQSQMSAKPFTPKASPHPPSLQLERDEKHIEDERASKDKQSDQYVSKESVLTDTSARSEKYSSRSEKSERYASKQSLAKSETKYSESFETESKTDKTESKVDKQSRISERGEDDARSQRSGVSRGSHRSETASRASKRSDVSRGSKRSERSKVTDADKSRYSARQSELGSSLSPKGKESPAVRGSPVGSGSKRSPPVSSRTQSPAQKSQTKSPVQKSRTESPAQKSPVSTGRQSKTGSVASQREERAGTATSAEKTETYVSESPVNSAQPPVKGGQDDQVDDGGRGSVSTHPDTVRSGKDDTNTSLPPESVDGQTSSTQPRPNTPSERLD